MLASCWNPAPSRPLFSLQREIRLLRKSHHFHRLASDLAMSTRIPQPLGIPLLGPLGATAIARVNCVKDTTRTVARRP